VSITIIYIQKRKGFYVNFFTNFIVLHYPQQYQGYVKLF